VGDVQWGSVRSVSRGLAAACVCLIALPVAAAAASDPSVTITEYSPTVSGGLGQNVAGVGVTARLERGTGSFPLTLDTVASATTTTDANGNWALTMIPTAGGPADGFDPGGDWLEVQYTATAGTYLPVPAPVTFAADQGNSPASSVVFAGAQSMISSDGETITAPPVSATPGSGPSCAPVGFLIDAVAHATSLGADGACAFDPSTPVSDENHVQAVLTSTYDDGSSASTTLTTISDVGVLGAGPSSCSADLVTDEVTCTGLNRGTFAVALNGGAPVPLTKPSSVAPGESASGAATVPGLESGDVLTLREVGVTRTLSTLHLFPLRGAFTGDWSITGECGPGRLLEFIPDAWPPCPANGELIQNWPYLTLPTEIDDLSGGTIQASVPSLSNLSPTSSAPVATSGFTASAEINAGTPASQALAETRSVKLTVIPAGGSESVFAHDMTPHRDNTGALETASVPSLAKGDYQANFLLTDVNGDTVAYSTRFTATPQIPGTSTEPGPRELTSKLRCKRTGTRTTNELCNMTVHAPGSRLVIATISRAGKTYASGKARINRGSALVELRTIRPIKSGRYLVTITAKRAHTSVKIRYMKRL
jgi:hypothetical protein